MLIWCRLPMKQCQVTRKLSSTPYKIYVIYIYIYIYIQTQTPNFNKKIINIMKERHKTIHQNKELVMQYLKKQTFKRLFGNVVLVTLFVFFWNMCGWKNVWKCVWYYLKTENMLLNYYTKWGLRFLRFIFVILLKRFKG